MKNRSVAAELFHADGRTDGNDEANIHFSQFYECAPKKNQPVIAIWENNLCSF